MIFDHPQLPFLTVKLKNEFNLTFFDLFIQHIISVNGPTDIHLEIKKRDNKLFLQALNIRWQIPQILYQEWFNRFNSNFSMELSTITIGQNLITFNCNNYFQNDSNLLTFNIKMVKQLIGIDFINEIKIDQTIDFIQRLILNNKLNQNAPIHDDVNKIIIKKI